MSKKKFTESMSSKGYYIALILCAVAIGICGYMFFQNAEDAEPTGLADPVSTLSPTDALVEALATQPSTEQTQPTESSTQVSDPLPQAKPVRPVDGQVISGYAMDALSYNQTTRDWRTHNGIDIAAQAGTAVCSAMDGTVYTVYEDDTMGTTVVIRHGGGYVTTYASLDSAVKVAPGDTVYAGQAIGAVGNTALLETALGEHLHFSVTCDGEAVDPEAFLG